MDNPFIDISVSGFGADFKEEIVKPTASILISDEPILIEILKPLIQNLYSIGCRHFMTWGDSAETLHDLVDEVLEGKCLLEGVTTSHDGESANEVAWFFLKATFPGENEVRYRIIASKKSNWLTEFLGELKTIVKTETGSASVAWISEAPSRD